MSILSMLGIFLFAVFSYWAFTLAIKRIYKSIIIFCTDLDWFQNYHDEVHRFGFSMVTYLLANNFLETGRWVSIMYFILLF